uniref:Uncharacterized protein n=1 Tax=Rhizophora mucronata TaxID=61149 RepID=A0A2P2Q6M7_RHIMU
MTDNMYMTIIILKKLKSKVGRKFWKFQHSSAPKKLKSLNPIPATREEDKQTRGRPQLKETNCC